MCKKVFLSFLLCALFIAPGYTQPTKDLAVEVAKKTSLTKEQITQLLLQRLESSYINAACAMQQYPLETDFIGDDPYTTLLTPPTLIQKPEELNPQMQNILTTPEQWSMYLVSSHNRRLTSQLHRARHVLQNYYAQFPLFHQQKQVIDVPTEQYMKKLADIIPSNTKYLLLGERHINYLHAYTGEFISHIAKKTDKQIILLTEFMPHSAHTKNQVRRQELLDEFWPVWKAAKQAHIPVAGLEPEFAMTNDNIYACNEVTDINAPFWGTLEGIALRNQYWLELIKSYRKAFPDALFIIYGGVGHFITHRPYSLGKTLAGPETFTALILPADDLNNPDVLSHVSTYDTCCAKQNLPFDPFVKFDYPLSQKIGFNARLFMPTPQE